MKTVRLKAPASLANLVVLDEETPAPATFAESMAACRLDGHLAVVGLLSGVTAEVNIPALFSAQLRVSGISIGNRADQET